ncbi:riboflavin kinase/FMN adenylyltransferase [Rhodovulum bhavnagarense]|uniref:Riboflavin biosynthesis protein n=1 Tax=Rhodovulum bhavnagarense TaxID=992286 RepID=A0A4R2RHA8_9RHOB|nr:bifunctional riboflavin kinase/FAD synthetase [Rhodovulum bhavnagarense]TCP63090.1 riboflavin kinase/FMN adenylyltransferase [Rhodovulum bhavnagarense]
MQTFTTWTGPAEGARGAVAAIGNFDGVHLGHRAVIDVARAEARRRSAHLGVLTFEPHPREFFTPEAAPFRLMNAEARANRLAKLGVDHLYQLPFDATLAALTPEAFAHQIIARGLGLSHVVVGADFCFGKAREGNVDALKRLGDAMGFGVSVVEIMSNEIGEVSSTAIREALTDGRPHDAARMLGHWHRIEGAVLHGDARGRALGYPTANMSIHGLHRPRFGVYAVRVDVLSGRHEGTYDGAASIGVRPMFGENVPNCETFLLDFAGDLYGTHLSVALVEFLRDEMRFDSLNALVDQMARDCGRARDILAGVPALPFRP